MDLVHVAHVGTSGGLCGLGDDLHVTGLLGIVG